MWFEILPSIGIIAGVMSVPTIACYVLNQLVFKKPYIRQTMNPHEEVWFLRDQRLTGKGWKCASLSEWEELKKEE